MVTRWLRAMGGASGPDVRRAARLPAFRLVLLLHGASRTWLWIHFGREVGGEVGGALWVASAVGLSFACVLACFRTTESWSARLALPILFLQLASTFPVSDNHLVLEIYAVALLSLLSQMGGAARDDEERWVLAGLRTLVAIVLVHAGLAKVLHGYYFGGEFLAFMVGRGDRFADLFQWLLPAAEVVRLEGYDPLLSGQGPYRVASLPFVLASNLVWIAELGLGALLLWRRTWPAAAFVAIAFVLGLQLAAREVGFAALFVVLLLLFTHEGNRRTLPAFVCFYLYVLGAAAGWLPGGSLITPGSL